MLLIINGHPSRNSFTKSVAESYTAGARESAIKVEILNLSDLKFDPILHDGYKNIQELEPDLIRAQALIRTCRRMVFFYPQWWGSGPALLKGFIDRVFLPGFAFKYRENSVRWDKLLDGRSGEIWLMSDSPWFWYFFAYWNSPVKWLKTATLDFCGVTPVKVNIIDRVRSLSEEQRKKALNRAYDFGVVAGKKVFQQISASTVQ